jgi:TM2 domain-containing membrane protein YozV
VSLPRPHDDDWILAPRAPSPGIAAVLSVLLPGLGQVYCGRLGAGALWLVATTFCYWAVLLPGFLVHALCVWSAYQGAKDWRHY